jgi:non-ribosomal peptide synthetase component F
MMGTVPCRIHIDATSDIESWLQSIHQDQALVNEYAHSSLNSIRKWAGHSGEGRFLNFAFVMENLPKQSLGMPSVETIPELITDHSFEDMDGSNMNDFDLQLLVFPDSDRYTVRLNYDARTIPSGLVSRFLEQFESTLQKLVAPEMQKMLVHSTMNLDSIHEKRLLALGRGPEQDIPYECAHYAFEQCARSNPDLVAVEQGSRSITYGELDKRASEIAALLQMRGVKVGDFVGLVTIRSIEMVCGIFGILKAGAAYVPVDAELPLERISLSP